MSEIEVTTQAQLDKAIENLKDGDWIVCLGGTWNNPLVAWGSSHVVARESSHVVARESSHVVARESSRRCRVCDRDRSRRYRTSGSAVLAGGDG